MVQILHKKVEHALESVEAFSTLLETETFALKKLNYALFESLQDEKLNLAQKYQDALLAFEEHIDVLKDLDPVLKSRLQSAHKRFSIVAEDNQNTLSTTSKVSERIVKLIMGAARKTVMDAPSYSAGGVQGLSEKIPVHFKLNEVL